MGWLQCVERWRQAWSAAGTGSWEHSAGRRRTTGKEVRCYLKANSDLLKMYIKNPGAATKKFLKRRKIDTLREEIEQNHTKCSVKNRAGRKSVEWLSRVWLFATSWTVARQAPLSMEFSRQDYWSGLSFPPPRDLPDPGIELASPGSPELQADSLPLRHQGNRGRIVIIILLNL